MSAVRRAQAVLVALASLAAACGPQTCPHPADSATFAVTGDCGPDAVVTVRSAADSCAVEAEGAELAGLPPTGNAGAGRLADGGWSLNGFAPGQLRTCLAYPGAGGLLLVCNENQPGACSATLLPR